MPTTTQQARDVGGYVRTLVGLLILAFGAATIATARRDPAGSFGGVSVAAGIAELAAAWSLAFVGLVHWRRHPRNLLGPLLVAAGVAWLLPEWSNPAVGSGIAFTGGLVGFAACAPLIAHAALAYPSGRLGRVADRSLVIVAYAVSVVVLGLLTTSTFDPNAQGCLDCPRNFLSFGGHQTLFDAFNRWGIRAGLAWMLLFAPLAAWRVFRSRAALTILVPVILPAAAYLALSAWDYHHSLGRGALSNDPFDQRLWRLEAASLFALALGVSWGLLRRMRARESVARLVVELAESPRAGGVRNTLAEALADPSAELAYARTGSDDYVDADGTRVEIDGYRPGRAATSLLRAGRPLAVLAHDARLLNDPGFVEDVIAAARLAVENEQLQAEVRAQLKDLNASRARIIETGDAERRRLERDLHDGAQQRLVGLSLALRLLRSQLGEDTDPSVQGRIDEADAELRQALADLRELAHGIHPAVLTDDGLAAAVESLAERSTIRIELGELPEERLPSAVESAAYYTIAEAVKRSFVYSATVDVTRHEGLLVVVVRCRMAGGAEDGNESARITDMRDRVGAVDGTLVVEQDETGTAVRAEIPCV